MRMLHVMGVSAAIAVAGMPAMAQDAFDACLVFTQSDAEAAMGTSALFRFARSEGDAQKAFDDARLQYQTKPMYISGADAFWSAKTGQMNLRKGRAWVSLSVGPAKLAEREMVEAKKLAELLVKKL